MNNCVERCLGRHNGENENERRVRQQARKSCDGKQKVWIQAESFVSWKEEAQSSLPPKRHVPRPLCTWGPLSSWGQQEIVRKSRKDVAVETDRSMRRKTTGRRAGRWAPHHSAERRHAEPAVLAAGGTPAGTACRVPPAGTSGAERGVFI